MELALLCGANPRVCKEGPVTNLGAGEWLIEARGNTDSTMGLNVGSGMPALHTFQGSYTLRLDRSTPVNVSFRIPGTERSVSVIAKKQS